MKVLTSVTMHTTSEGQRLSYTHSIVDENTGAITTDNIRESMIVMDIPANSEVLEHIAAIKKYVSAKLEADNGR